MSHKEDWYQVEFTEAYVEEVKKKKIDWKQNLQGDVKTRWVGELGEEAFRLYMKTIKRPIKDKTQNGASWVDFEIDFMKVDVKTVATNYFPTEEYACNISPIQHERNKEADTYVFARYIIPQRIVVILGWVSKHEFEINALTRMSGDKVTEKFKTNGELMELEIKFINSLKTL